MSGMPDDDFPLRLVTEQCVRFARGGSDDEAIRNREDINEGRTRYGYRQPHCYRLEQCLESSKYYRRILKALLDTDSGTLTFEPAYESDDEGHHD